MSEQAGELELAPPARPETFIDEWERQPGEPLKAFSGFVIYRDMGDERAVKKVREMGLRASAVSIFKWADQWRWVDRAEAYDRLLDRRKVQARVEEIESQARRMVDMGQVLQGTGLQFVQEQLDTEEKRKAGLTASAALRFIESGVTLERKGLGVDDAKAAETNVNITVLDAGTKVDMFDKIDAMHAAIHEDQQRSQALPVDEEIIDAEIVEEDEVEEE